MFKGKVLLFSLLLGLLATSLYAGDVDDCNSEVYLSTSPLRVSICPQGDFEYIYHGAGGSSDYIRVIARDSGNNGIPGIPWTDYWISPIDGSENLCLCASPIVADSLTNGNGETTISGRIAGGGCVSHGVAIAIQGRTILSQPNCVDPVNLDMVLVSPDLTADCYVSISDFGIFAGSYNKAYPDPAFNTCCDFNDDDICDLSDFGFFGAHYQHQCF